MEQLTVHLLASDTLDVNDPLSAVDRHHFAFPTLESSAHNLNFVILSDRDGSNLQPTKTLTSANVSRILVDAELNTVDTKTHATRHDARRTYVVFVFQIR